MVSKALISFIFEVISQTEMLRNTSKNALSTDLGYVVQLLEASSVRRDEIVDNHRGDLGRPIYHTEKEELQEDFLISTVPDQNLDQHIAVLEE